MIGGCFDSEFATWSNGLMRDFREANFKPVVSEVVAAEIRKAPEIVREKYAELLELEVEIILIEDESLKLLRAYQSHKVLEPRFRNDMLHIAMATIAEVDVLVSWNFKHIVHLDRIRHFNAVNMELGYKPLQIFSPREVTNYE